MGSKERKGTRRDRSKKLSTRVPTLGYYLIVTDTQETERNYFEGLRETIPEHLKDRLIIKVERARTVDLVQKCRELISKEPQYRIPWIILDRDQIACFDEIILAAEKNDINVGWSNPCIEIWFYSYFDIPPTCIASTVCCDKFKNRFRAITASVYEKSDAEIYNKLSQFGDEKTAIKIAKQNHKAKLNDGILKPSKMVSTTTLYQLVGEIREKITTD